MKHIDLKDGRGYVLEEFVQLITDKKNGYLSKVEQLINEQSWLIRYSFFGDVTAHWECVDDEESRSLLHIAVGAFDSELIRLLVKKGSPINARAGCFQTPLSMLLDFQMDAEEGASLAHAMIDLGARCDTVDADGCSMLLKSLPAVNQDLAQRLHQAGAAVDAFRSDGSHWLGTLVRWGSHQESFSAFVDQLIDWGLGTRIESDHAGDPLIATLLDLGLFDQAQVLVDRGFNVHRRGHLGRTLLSHVETAPAIGWLLDRGLDINAQDHLGRTPLAHRLGYPSVGARALLTPPVVARALIEAGADTRIKDHEDRCPRDMIAQSDPTLFVLVQSMEARKVARAALGQMAQEAKEAQGNRSTLQKSSP